MCGNTYICNRKAHKEADTMRVHWVYIDNNIDAINKQVYIALVLFYARQIMLQGVKSKRLK